MAAPLESPPSDNLYMKEVSRQTPPRTLCGPCSATSRIGTLVSVRILPTPPGVESGAALVRMGSVPEAQHLVDNAGQFAAALGTPLTVKFAASGQKGGGKGAPHGAAAPPPPPVAAPGASAAPSTRLYVRGLPLGITEDQVTGIFSGYGSCVSCKVLQQTPGGPPNAAAIVQMSAVQEAQWLVDNVNGNIPQGLPGPVEVRFKQDRADVPAFPPGPPAPAAAVPAGAGGVAPSEHIFLKGLPSGLTAEAVASILASYGTAVSSTIVQSPDPPNGATDTACLVRMSSLAEAAFLVDNLNGNIPHGLTVPVSVCYSSGAPAPPAEEPPLGPKGGGRGAAAVPRAAHAPGGPPGPSERLWMRGLPEGITAEAPLYTSRTSPRLVSTKILPSPPGANDVAGLVRMSSVAEAQWLVANVNGNIPQGMSAPVEIKFANSSGPGGPRAGAAAAHVAAGVCGQPCRDNLYVKGFPPDINEAMLRGLLGQYGTVRACKILPPPPGQPAAAGIVRMASPQDRGPVARGQAERQHPDRHGHSRGGQVRQKHQQRQGRWQGEGRGLALLTARAAGARLRPLLRLRLPLLFLPLLPPVWDWDARPLLGRRGSGGPRSRGAESSGSPWRLCIVEKPPVLFVCYRATMSG
ncbi:unnamed protein product, partial [Prorocentrum cordatum]